MMEWISVEDRLPEVGDDVLIFPPQRFDDVLAIHNGKLYQHEDKKWWMVHGNGAVYNITPTHWMPLPDPPKA